MFVEIFDDFLIGYLIYFAIKYKTFCSIYGDFVIHVEIVLTFFFNVCLLEYVF